MEKNNKSALNDGSSFFLLISNKNMIKLTESLSGTVPKAQWECNLALSICRFCYFMYSICQISNIARSNTRHTARQPSYMRNIHVWRESEGRRKDVLPYSTIASHINMKFVCQTINLFRCHSTIAKHANLFAR